MSPMKDLLSTIIDSFGAFLTAVLLGWYNTFMGPFYTLIAGWLGLPTG